MVRRNSWEAGWGLPASPYALARREPFCFIQMGPPGSSLNRESWLGTMPYVIGIDAMTQIEVSSLFSLTSKQEGKDGKDRPWRWYDSSDHGRGQSSIVKVFLTDKGALRLGLRIRRGYERGSSTYGAWGNWTSHKPSLPQFANDHWSIHHSSTNELGDSTTTLPSTRPWRHHCLTNQGRKVNTSK